jgi:hypothetical protein
MIAGYCVEGSRSLGRYRSAAISIRNRFGYETRSTSTLSLGRNVLVSSRVMVWVTGFSFGQSCRRVLIARRSSMAR